MARAPHHRMQKARPLAESTENTGSTVLGQPVFAQPLPTPDPMKFEIKHRSDDPAYKQIDVLNREHKLEPMPFPEPRNIPEPRLSLEDILGDGGATAAQKITQSGQLVFHSTGDTGNIRGPESQNIVADKPVNDFSDEDGKQRPCFFFHLGDVIYSFGGAQ
jgi:hypothetical protein